jgi:hypothetical protein
MTFWADQRSRTSQYKTLKILLDYSRDNFFLSLGRSTTLFRRSILFLFLTISELRSLLQVPLIISNWGRFFWNLLIPTISQTHPCLRTVSLLWEHRPPYILGTSSTLHGVHYPILQSEGWLRICYSRYFYIIFVSPVAHPCETLRRQFGQCQASNLGPP